MPESRDPAFEHVCLGGTFSPLHRGHKALLEQALAVGEHVFAGVTTGELSQRNREREVPPVEERIADVRAYLEERGLAERVELGPIEDPYGRALEPRFEAIVVSPETRTTAERINAERAKRDLEPLVIETVPFVLGLDGEPVNGTRVAAGEVDPEGTEPKRVHLAIGSTNPVKVGAAEHAFGRWVPNVTSSPVEVDSGVPEQPRGEQGPQGAARRARRALEAVEDAGLGVGIEAALVEDAPTGETFDIQYCAIADRQGRVTTGAGPGFRYPASVLEQVDAGATVGDAFEALAGREDIGAEEGAIGYLTHGGATREELTEWAILTALVPRLRPELYDPLPSER